MKFWNIRLRQYRYLNANYLQTFLRSYVLSPFTSILKNVSQEHFNAAKVHVHKQLRKVLACKWTNYIARAQSSHTLEYRPFKWQILS